MKGRITRWHDDKGYGFVTAENGQSKIFLHISAVKDSRVRPVKNDTVTFDLEKDNQGRFRALNVQFAGVKRYPATVLFAGLFLVSVAVMAVTRNDMWLPGVVYMVMSVLTYVIYAADKRAAEHGRWRTPENTLHMMALAGGWPGALMAQSQLRHKSKKQPFKTLLWLTIVLNVVGFIWAFSLPGHTLITQLAGLLMSLQAT